MTLMKSKQTFQIDYCTYTFTFTSRDSWYSVVRYLRRGQATLLFIWALAVKLLQ